MNNIKDLFYELINEASKAQVMIDGETWPIAFNTIIRDGDKEKVNTTISDSYNTLIIKNEKEFLTLLEKYLDLEKTKNRKTPKFYYEKEKSTLKHLISYIFVNATTEDFLNPNQLLKREISFLEDNTFNYLDKELILDLSNKFKNSKLSIKRELSSTSMETPYKIDLALKDSTNNSTYNLPSIYYGIANENGEKTCYIYSLINKKKEEQVDEKYQKQINRLLYKLNNGVAENEMSEYFDYKAGNITSYPEGNISDVTPSFVLAASIFTSLLQKENIKKLKIVTYLPLRHASREISADNQKDPLKQQEFSKRNDNIQTNATSKLIRTFRRVAFHNQDISIVGLPYEVDEFLTLTVNKRNNELNNMLLEETNLLLNDKKTK